MKNILIFGAGRSSGVLIETLLNNAGKEDWFVTVGDFLFENASERVAGHPHGKAIQLDIYNDEQRSDAIKNADVVVSYLLPEMHPVAAQECLKHNAHLVTASYVSKEMEELDKEAKAIDLIFLNEMGLDPGIDHMDAARLIKKIKNEGGKIISLKSYCGGLVSPESDDNPWGYKFTWSPISVVRAGSTGAKYLNNGIEKSIPYQQVFKETEDVEIPGLGVYEAYPNRDSIPYLNKFGLNGVEHYMRATLRKPGFAQAWDALIKIGLTNDTIAIHNSDALTYEKVIRMMLPSLTEKNTENLIADFLSEKTDSGIMKKLSWLGIMSNEEVPVKDATSAQILLSLLKKKWVLKTDDKDMVILQTEVEYLVSDKKKKIISTMIYKGTDKIHTAMTYTASLPAAIAVKLITQNKIKERGVIIPAHPDIFEPALKELEENGIRFGEVEREID